MRKRTIFRDGYEVTDTDLETVVDAPTESDDTIVLDAIQRGRRFTGMAVSPTGQTSISVAPGRLWFEGARYYLDDEGGYPIELLSVRPTTLTRVIAIVATPEEIDTDIEDRDFETDAETQIKEPRTVNTRVYRHVRLEAVAGTPAVVPLAPVIIGQAVIIALVSMDPTGIISILRNEAAELDNLGDVAVRTQALEDFQEQVSPQISSISTDLARVQSQLANLGNQTLVYAIAKDVAELRELANLPAAYINYRATYFLNTDNSAPTWPGFKAKLEEGLRFPPAAVQETTLALGNPFDPDVTISQSGLMLPKYSEVFERIVRGNAGQMSLAQYSFEQRSFLQGELSRSRTRYGQEFETSTGSALWLSGNYVGDAGIKNVFRLNNGETFQVTETGKVDADGHRIVRLAQFWQDTIQSTYWQRKTTEAQIEGYAFVETFLQRRDAWLLGIAPHITQKPADGLLHLGICETENGYPRIDRMIARNSAPASFWQNVGGAVGGLGLNKLSMIPTLLDGGARFGMALLTAADYRVAIASAESFQPTGTLFYGLNGGIFQSDPSRHVMWDAYFARFERTRVEIGLGSISLAGGIGAIDILAQTAVPESTSLVFEIQVNGQWRPLSATSAGLLDTLPNLVPLRAVFTGTQDMMPALNLGVSRVRVSRPDTVVKHVSDVWTFNAPSATIEVITRLRNFDPAHHTHSVKVLTGGSYATVETADAVEDIVRDGVRERHSFFTLAGPATSARIQIDNTTDSATNLFLVESETDIAK